MKKLKRLMPRSNGIRSSLSSRDLWMLLVLSLPFVITFVGCEGDTITLTPETNEGIQVSGTGSAFGEPDVAVLSLGVSTEKKSVAEAREDAADAMQKVLDTLKGNGVSEKDLQTKQYSIQPQYDYVDGQRILRGYRVTNTVSAKIRTLDKIGNIIDDAAEAGGNAVQVQSIGFTIDDPTELQAQARVEAMKNAQDKAETLAEEGGVTLGKPISISESTGYYAPNYSFDDRESAGAVKTPIETGELEIAVTVSVLYEIDE